MINKMASPTTEPTVSGSITGESWMGFIGVSTGGSLIREIFPAWAEKLMLPTSTLIGHDLPIEAPVESYRDLVASIRDDPRHRGALVTTHKTAIYAAAADLFDELDDSARAFEEISSISKRGGRLVGRAMDPITARLALEEFIGDSYFGGRRDAAVLGCGGAGVALSHQLGMRRDRPRRIICTDVSEHALNRARSVHARANLRHDRYEYLITDRPEGAADMLAELAPGSLVVNATGLGKDRSGSPVTPAATFPEGGVVWEFNYRGQLDFLHHARRQRTCRSLQIEDGWRYFIHGWTQVIADVFAIDMPGATVTTLSRIASRFRR